MKQSFADYLAEFARSLPAEYRDRHDAEAMAAHARLAKNRVGRAVSGVFRASRDEGLPVCVIADDAPGLLSRMSAAFVLSQLDVVRAEAYSRKRPDAHTEAVDLFWVRHAGARADSVWIGPVDVARFHTTLVVLLDGTFDRAALIERLRGHAAASRTGSCEVRFVRDERGTLAALDVSADDRHGLLFTLTDTLFRERLVIVRSEIRTIGDRIADRFYVRELDGSCISWNRQAALEVALLQALDPLGAGLTGLAKASAASGSTSR
jgi:[protein-PII] uridylyltransferase